MLDTVALSADAYGPQAVPAFVISMTEQPSDVLAATWLAQRAGATALRMVPLFETRAALEEAPATMAELYACEPYVAHLRTQANRQTVMVGYSDSGKDTGYIGSSWALHNAQEQLAAQAAEAGIVLELFHGRGGSPVARRRAHLPRDPGPARGHRQRAHPDHRAGRDGLRALRRRGARRTLAGADGVRGAAGVARCRTRRSATSGAWRWSGCRRARASATAGWSTTTPSSCASSARWRRSPSSASSTSGRGRRRARAPPGSSRCARSRGSSPGRRTACCCPPGTAPARRWRPATSSCSARCGATGRSSAA